MTTVLLDLSLEQLRESPFNRQTFDAAKLEELASSLKQHGQTTAAIVRPVATKKGPQQYEIAAGARRFRAAALASLSTLRCEVRDMDDQTFLAFMAIENLQRENLHPMDEAEAFEHVRNSLGANGTAAGVAAKVQRTTDYVRDVLQLRALTKEAQKAFRGGKFSLEHAVLIARQTPAVQKEILGPGMALYISEGREDGLDGQLVLGAAATANELRTPRQLASWINRHVRLDLKAPVTRELFPETVQVAQEKALEVVHITRNHQVHPDARDAKRRTYGPMSWKRADGELEDGEEKRSKRCDLSVIGVVVVGPGRGESFAVCIAKEKCRVHWPPKPKAKSQTARAGASEPEEEDWQARQRRMEEERKAREARWTKAMPAIQEAVEHAIGKLAEKALIPVLFELTNMRQAKASTLAEAVRLIVCDDAMGEAHDDWRRKDFIKRCKKEFNVDVSAILNREAPVVKTEEPKGEPAKKERKAAGSKAVEKLKDKLEDDDEDEDA